ncbi:hypothetical protein HWV62_26610 [Athelia sp. TMB]|nr:hypothetical protein HWV62_26610 [Athelia sp. TMB]
MISYSILSATSAVSLLQITTMAPSPQCSALNAAMTKTAWRSRVGSSYGDIAAKTGLAESHIIAICTGTQEAKPDEYNALAAALDIKAPVPHDSAHKNA